MRTVEGYSKIITIGFNQTKESIMCGTERGFHVFPSSPFDVGFYRDINSGINVIEMLNNSNIIAFVGNGKYHRYPLNKVILWDDHLTKIISEINVDDNVISLKFFKSKLAIILKTKVYLYIVPEMKIYDVFKTAENPMGAYSFGGINELFAVSLSNEKGGIYIKYYDKEVVIEKTIHESTITCIEVSPDSKICATTTVTGKTIEIFSTENGDLIKQVRRGIDSAHIYNLSFDPNSKWLACSSDKGTLHIFSVDNSSSSFNKLSHFRCLKGMIGYFGSEWSFANYKSHTKNAIVSFINDNKIILLSKEGYYYLLEFNPIKGECKLLQQVYIF